MRTWIRHAPFLLLCGPLVASNPPVASVAYTRNGKVEVVNLGEEKARVLGNGQFVRWGPEGKRLAVVNGKTLSVMEADGRNRRVLAQDVKVKDGSPLDFHPDGNHILYLAPDRHFQRINLSTGERVSHSDWGTFTGEPCYADGGKWLVAREERTLWKVNTQTGVRTRFATGCSPMMTADGRYLLHNLGGHQRLAILNADGTPKTELSTRTQRPDTRWDNHHASNHPDYLTAQGEKGPRGAYVVRISDNRIWRAGQKGGVQYPDVFIHQAASSENILPTSPRVAEPKEHEGPIEVRARLVERTPTPSLTQLEEYRHALVTDLYHPITSAGPVSADTPIVVIRWAVKDRKAVPPNPENAEGIHHLRLSPFAAFPELRSERLIDDVGDMETPRYFLLEVKSGTQSK